MKKFIKGTFELDTEVWDLPEYERPKEAALRSILDWGTELGIAIRFGTSSDGSYLCEYNVRARTASLCRGYVAELRQLLKPHFPKVETLFQASGDLIH